MKELICMGSTATEFLRKIKISVTLALNLKVKELKSKMRAPFSTADLYYWSMILLPALKSHVLSCKLKTAMLSLFNKRYVMQ